MAAKNRAIKKEIRSLLSQDDFDKALMRIGGFPPNQVIGPLFTHFYHGGLVRWRAISAMGTVVAQMAEGGQTEQARVVLRRMMWNLNDESGGIGWGSPEAMGDITAKSERLAKEFHRILTSYVWEDGNFLEHPQLQRGSLWGVGRLAHARPDLVLYAAEYLAPFLASEDPFHRGLAAWAVGPIATPEIRETIRALADDGAELTIFRNGGIQAVSVGSLATAAVSPGSII